MQKPHPSPSSHLLNMKNNTLPPFKEPSTATSTLMLAYETFLQYFKKTPTPDLPELNTLSAILQKLTASYNQLQTLEVKKRELNLKELEHANKQHEPTNSQKNSLTPDELNSIEQQLKLL